MHVYSETREFRVVYHRKQVERLVINKTLTIIQYGSPNLREKRADTVSKVELEK